MKARKLKYEEIPLWYKFNLYEDFLANEVKPHDNILKLHEEGCYDIFTLRMRKKLRATRMTMKKKWLKTKMLLTAKKHFVLMTSRGYATIWKFQGSDTYLLDNLGVSVTYRNKGLGASVLKDIRNQILNDEIAEGKCLDDDSLAEFCLVVESDTPLEKGDAEENELRRRRC